MDESSVSNPQPQDERMTQPTSKPRLVRPSVKKPGAGPGHLVFTGAHADEGTTVEYMDYDAEKLEEAQVDHVADCFGFFETPSVTWVDIVGLSDVEQIRALGEHLDLHPLLLEDVLSTRQRPKVEEYPNQLFVVIRMLQWPEGETDLIDEQVSLVVGDNYVISFQERSGDVFGPVRERIRSARGTIRRRGSDYMAYALMDAVVDHYFGILERIGDKVEALEERTLEGLDPSMTHRIHHLKRQTALTRRSIWPLREVLGTIYRGEHPLIAEETKLFFRDVYDHSVQVIDTLETLRDVAAGVMDLHMSAVSNRMNEIMKVLTIMSSMFIPLSFMAGVYGMNFDVMPELHVRWAYPALLIAMLTVVVGMLTWFRRKGWL